MFLPGTDCQGNIIAKPKDCTEVLQMGHNVSGVYKIWPVSRVTENKLLDVYCDMDTNGGGWTVSNFDKSVKISHI